MKNMTILILHGVQSKAGAHWMQWLHDELISLKHTVLMPQLPHADHPGRQEWFDTIKDLLKDVDASQLVIVGHSLGVPAALDFIEQAPSKIKALISVSGFSDNYGSEYNDFYMQEKTIDFAKVKSHLEQSFVFYGDDDPYVPQQSLQMLANDLGVQPTILHSGGHINSETGYTTFPKLLETIKHIQ
jgi:predicted alpha/beta hydrolase family esterase